MWFQSKNKHPLLAWDALLYLIWTVSVLSQGKTPSPEEISRKSAEKRHPMGGAAENESSKTFSTGSPWASQCGQSASQDGWVVNVFQQEEPSSRARRAVWSRQLSPAAAPPCSPPKKQPMGINLRAWLAADLKQSACLSPSLSLSRSLTPPHSVWNVPLIRPLLCSALLSFPTNSTVNENGKVFLRTGQ